MPGLVGGSPGLQFGVYAALGYDVMSATNSSPQTTELFASDRSSTLMKWVHIGAIQGIALGLIGTWLEKSWWPLIGTTAALGIMYAEYRHADASGKDPDPSGGKMSPAAANAQGYWNNPT